MRTARSALRFRLAAVISGDPRDAGGVITGWFLKIAVVLLVLAVIGFDAVSIASTKVNASDTADTAAMAGSVSWNQQHDAQLAYRAADEVAEQHGCRVLTNGFAIDRNGTVHLIVQATAHTEVVTHIGPLRHWATVDSAGLAKDIS